jgi:redox-sensitive bicupin YhaK (pirin superfamily)
MMPVYGSIKTPGSTWVILIKGVSTEYNIKAEGNGVYVFVLKGDVKVNDDLLNPRDGYGIWDTDKFTITAETDAEFLLMEVPMEFKY